MTKVQMKAQALELMTSHKANKKLTEAMTALFEEYAKNSKLDSVKREKLIDIKGTTYQWCNRHEIYEPLENFKNDKSPECKLATKYWTYLGAKVKTIQEKLDKAIEDEKYDTIKDIKHELDQAKALRGGRYDREGNELQFPDIENYLYAMDNCLTDEQATEALTNQA